MATVLQFDRQHAAAQKVSRAHLSSHIPKVPFCSQSNADNLRSFAVLSLSEMSDAERDARSPFEWQQSILAYVEFRMGDKWRRLHRPGQRFADVRQHWLEVFRTCSVAFNSPEHKPQAVLSRTTNRLAAAITAAEKRRA